MQHLTGIFGWNLIWLTYQAFAEKYEIVAFVSFTCPE